MRVIGGEFGSRRLKTLPGRDTRPTPDRLRETLFDILQPRIEGAVFVDAYAGTGAVGIEALSRGAARAVFLERSRKAVAVIRENLQSLGIEDRATVVQGFAASALAQQRGDILFLDPPYEMQQEYAVALRSLGAAPSPLVVVQHSAHFDLEETYGALRRTRRLKQGDNVLSFYSLT